MKKVLVVDDQPCIRRTLGRILRDAGIACEFASEVSEAISLVCTHAYDLVLSDIDMPGDKTGVDLVRWLRSEMPELPVVVVSGVSDVGVITTVTDLGAEAYLLKPFFPQQALLTIRSALTRSERRHAESAGAAAAENRAATEQPKRLTTRHHASRVFRLVHDEKPGDRVAGGGPVLPRVAACHSGQLQSRHFEQRMRSPRGPKHNTIVGFTYAVRR